MAILGTKESEFHETVPLWDKLERVSTFLLQVVGFVAALTFGVVSTLAWQVSIKALAEAKSANLITFLSLCEQAGSMANVGNKSVLSYSIFTNLLF